MAEGLLDWIKTPEGQGLLSAAFGGLAGARRGQPLNSIGRAGLSGLTGYGNALERQDQQAQQAKRNEYFDVQMSALKADAAEKERLRQLEQKRQAALPGLFAGTVTPGSISVPEIGGVEMFSQGPKVERASVRSGVGQFNVPEAIRTGLFKPEDIKQYADLANIGMPEVARTVEVDDGKGGKATLQLDKFGRPVGNNLPAYIAPVQVNRGDRVDFVRPAPGVSLGMNMTPGERASNALGWANNAVSRERLAFDKAGGAESGKAPSGYRWSPDGSSLVAIPGGPADKAASASEGERKAATLLTRMDGSLRQLQEVTGVNKSAAKPEVLPAAVRALTWGNEAAGNFVTSPDRQRVEAAQLDILDAALTLGTGAAYTKEQLEGYRKSYFPQMGDSDQTVKDKQARLDNVIQAARIAAGRAAPSGATPSDEVSNVLKKYGVR